MHFNMSCLSSEIPIIDVSSWIDFALNLRNNQNNIENYNDLLNEKHKQCSYLWNQCLHNNGYAVIIGHGISEELFKKMNKDMKDFFNKPYNVKKQYNHGKYGHPLGGYTGIGNEIVSLSNINNDTIDSKSDNNNNDKISLISNNKIETKLKFDPVENFVFTSCPSNYKSSNGELSSPFECSIEYYKEMNQLLDILHMISCDALEIEDLHYFKQFYYHDNEIINNNGNVLRLAYYPSIDNINGDNNQTDNKLYNHDIRYGAHTDYQGFTILSPDKNDWYTYSLDGNRYNYHHDQYFT